MAARAKRRPHRPARPRPVLGNDPFERGAAARPAAGSEAPVPPPAEPRGEAGPPEAAAPEAAAPEQGPAAPAPPPPDATPADYARELGEMLVSLLPALRERLAGLGELFHLGRADAPLDPYGMDPTLLDRAGPLLDFLYLSWWRVEASSAARLPDGPLVVVANRGGLLPWDALVLRLAVRRETRERRDLRPLLDA